MQGAPGRRGLGLAEVVVALVVVAVAILVILAALPRGRESARTVACRANLARIGVALAVYHDRFGRLPEVPDLEGRGRAPLAAMLAELGVSDLRGMDDPRDPPAREPTPDTSERPIPGFVCPSDRNAARPGFPAPVSYRANAGDAPAGVNGPFAPGLSWTFAMIEARDGVGYTAAFSERLVGDGKPERAPWNYARVPGPIRAGPCPDGPDTAWEGDAGSSWFAPGFRSTLYNHILTPNAAPSCLATDGASGVMGASGAHAGTVHVLILDGGVRPVTSQVDPKVWRALGNAEDSRPAPTPGLTDAP